MAQLDSCLDGLPALEQRVLELRSGLGPRRPRSRAGVGRALDLSPRRVGRLERRGLRRLRGLARGGRCAGGSAQPAAVVPAPAAAWETATIVSAARGPFAAPRSEDRIEVKAEQRFSDSDRDGVPAELAPNGSPKASAPPSAAVVRIPGVGATDLTLPLLVLVGLCGIALAVRSSVRSWRS
ncbi:MAG TPA: sigma factor-like helix-turn-helix DNA-binding protein [Solirubrobacteraceae bacterium]|nr:sigma factor-like helix-turn-helix DNA-binding protein [Solirubrobacteraceae bacterium]